MSLLIWMPFVDSPTMNNGILTTSISTLGSPDVTTSGAKFHKCLNRVDDSSGVKIDSNLISELGSEYTMAVWVCPLGNHTHYEGAFISSGDWNNSCWAFGVSQDNTKVDVAGGWYNRYIDCSVPVGRWTHLCCTVKGGISTLYKNGNYVGELSVGALESDYSWTSIQRETYANGYFSFNGKMNDLRIYNHSLSLAEIKDLAKGLVAHYPLKDPYIEPTNNIVTNYAYDGKSDSWDGHSWTNTRKSAANDPVPSPILTEVNITYNPSVGSGGANAYMGGFSCSPNTQYCYSVYIKAEDNFSYCHPNFLYRYEYSAVNSGYVTEGGVFNINQREPVGGGWYRCWGFFTTNSNTHWITPCFYTYPCKSMKYWITACQLEPSDHMTRYNLGGGTSSRAVGNSAGTSIEEGVAKGDLKISNDSPRYSRSTVFNGSNTYINCKMAGKVPDNITVAIWAYMNNWENYTRMISCTEGGGWNFEPGDGKKMRFACYISSIGYRLVHDSIPLSSITPGWHFFVGTWDGTNLKFYRDGELTGTITEAGYHGIGYNNDNSLIIGAEAAGGSSPAGDYFNGKLSDARIYATALSEENIKKLYKSPVKISKNDTLITTGEIVE